MIKLRYCFFAFFLLSILIAPLRGGYLNFDPFYGLNLSSFSGAAIGYLLLWYFLSKRNDVKILLAAMMGMSIISLPIHIFSFESSKVSFLEFLIHLVTLCVAFIIYRYARKAWKYVCTVIVFAGLYWISVPGYHLWIHYLNHGTFTGRIEARKISNAYTLRTATGDTIHLSDWKGKTVLLDFWSKHCGYCWKAFPQIQELHDKYKDSPDVLVATVFSPWKEENEWESVREEVQGQYSFPVFITDRNSVLLKDWEITRFPVYVILNENSEQIYRGNLEGAKKILRSLSSVEKDE